MVTFIEIIRFLIWVYIWVLIASAVVSWLIAFDVVNRHNQYARMIGEALYRLTEPPLRPIRKMLPNLGGLDISPVILILILIVIRDYILVALIR